MAAIWWIRPIFLKFFSKFWSMKKMIIPRVNKEERYRRLWDQRDMDICKQQSEIEMRHLPMISICGYVGGRQI